MHLRPSSAHIWTRCAAAPSFALRVPEEPPSDEAREGTAAAWVADAVLKGDASTCEDMLGKTHPNGWLVTPDMVQHVQKYVDIVKADGGVTTAENYVRLSEFIAGTLDSSTALADGRLKVRDLKYGYLLVEPTTPQLTIYGAAETMRLEAMGRAISEIELAIYQPRAYHINGTYRYRVVSRDTLMAEAAEIIAAGDRCRVPEPVATPGDHCTYCTAKLTCHAFVASTYGVTEHTRQRHMTPDELRNYWVFLDKWAPLLSAAKKAADAEIEARLRRGEYVPGMFLRPRFGHRKFTVPLDVVKAFTGVDPFKRVEMSPAEVEREGASIDVVNSLSRSQEIGRKVDTIPPDYFAKVFK